MKKSRHLVTSGGREYEVVTYDCKCGEHRTQVQYANYVSSVDAEQQAYFRRVCPHEAKKATA